MSDLGSHDNDVPYTVLDLKRPDGKGGRSGAADDRSRFAECAGGAQGARAGDDDGDLRIRRRRRAACAQAVWHQGDSKPPGWVPAWGGRSCVFIGEKGMLLGNGKLLPEEKFKDFQKPPETLPRSPGHWVEWVNYAKGNGPVPGSNFQYSGWTTEANHLGNVAYRTGKKIEWDYSTAGEQRAERTRSSDARTARAGTTF